MSDLQDNEVSIAVLRQQMDTLRTSITRLIDTLDEHAKREASFEEETTARLQELMTDKQVRKILRNVALVALGVASSLAGLWKVGAGFFAVMPK